MINDTVVSFIDPAFRDELNELARRGARRLIRQAVQVELAVFLDEHAAELNGRGDRRSVALNAPSERASLNRVGQVNVRWLCPSSESTNDFDEVANELFGESGKGLSPATLVRLNQLWDAGCCE